MCARLFVVDDESFDYARDKLIVAARVPTKKISKLWLRTYHDIMADMLQIRIGDYIFLWKVKEDNEKNSIFGVYRAISKPFFKLDGEGDVAPFKLHIEVAYEFKHPISEYDLLNWPHLHSPLWNIVGKKISNKARASTPLSPEEEKTLITILKGKNPEYKFYPFNPAHIKDVERPLRIDCDNAGTNPKEIDSYLKLVPEEVHPLNAKSRPYYEKTMEAIFNQEFANNNRSFFEQLGIDIEKVVWFSNYLPYSIEKSEMDYLILESDDGKAITHAYIIDFMLRDVDADHIERCIMYGKWVSRTIAYGSDIIQPIVLSEYSPDFIENDSEEVRNFNNWINKLEEDRNYPIQIFTYKYECGEWCFDRMR